MKPPWRDSDFGQDPWINDATREQTPLPELAAASHIYNGADTIKADIGILPTGLSMYASYVDNFTGYSELVDRFGPHFDGLLLSITVTPPGHRARCGDFEPGGLRNSDFPSWYDNLALKDGGQLPWGYTNAANMGTLISAAGGRPFIRWSAHVGHGPHICGPSTCGFAQAHWTQWAFAGPNGENYDRSIGTFLPVSPRPPLHLGTANAILSLDEHSGHWTVHGVAGHPLPPGADIWESVEAQFNRKRRVWRAHPMPLNAPPLGSN